MLYLTFSRCTIQSQRSVKIHTLKKKPEPYCLILVHTVYLPLTAINSEDSAAGDDPRTQNLYIV